MAARVKGGEKVADILIRSGANPDTRNEVCVLFMELWIEIINELRLILS
jgi:hypothetical protein